MMMMMMIYMGVPPFRGGGGLISAHPAPQKRVEKIYHMRTKFTQIIPF